MEQVNCLTYFVNDDYMTHDVCLVFSQNSCEVKTQIFFRVFAFIYLYVTFEFGNNKFPNYRLFL